jgi:hypothetical protein
VPAACTQTDASVLTAFGLVTVKVKCPACAKDSFAVPLAAVLALAPPALTAAPDAFEGVPLASL